MYSTLTTSGDVEIVLIRDAICRRRPGLMKCHRHLEESWHFVLFLNSLAKLNLHRTFLMRYSWLDICPLFSLIIDWLFCAFFRPLFWFKNTFLQFSFSLTFFTHYTYTNRIYRLRFESFWCFNIKSAISSASFPTFITIIGRSFITNENEGFDVNMESAFMV